VGDVTTLRVDPVYQVDGRDMNIGENPAGVGPYMHVR
jgi:hypothetical protein